MEPLIRGVMALGVGVCTYCFVFWVGAALLEPLGLPFVIPLLIGAIAGIVAGRRVWRRRSSGSGDLLQVAGTAAVVTGAIGFAIGFFGPMVFAPSANQGPLLGIFITGPLGFVAGGIGGAGYWWLRRARGNPPAGRRVGAR